MFTTAAKQVVEFWRAEWWPSRNNGWSRENEIRLIKISSSRVLDEVLGKGSTSITHVWYEIVEMSTWAAARAMNTLTCSSHYKAFQSDHLPSFFSAGRHFHTSNMELAWNNKAALKTANKQMRGEEDVQFLVDWKFMRFTLYYKINENTIIYHSEGRQSILLIYLLKLMVKSSCRNWITR